MRGVHAAIVTHFDAGLRVDHAAVAGEVERLIAAGVDGIVACGTMGEASSLTQSERAEVLNTVTSVVAHRVPVTAGISAQSATQAASYADDAVSAGVDALMVLPPLLYRADRAELLSFFKSVGASTSLPLMLYNNPDASGTDMKPELLAEVVEAVPSVTSIKECSGDARRIADLVARCDGVDVMVGGDDWVLEGCCMGAAGWISGVAVVFPRECAELWKAGVALELPEARRLYAALLPFSRFDMTPKLVQYFKAGLDELGIGGGPSRPPRMALTDAERTALRAALADATALTAR